MADWASLRSRRSTPTKAGRVTCMACLPARQHGAELSTLLLRSPPNDRFPQNDLSQKGFFMAGHSKWANIQHRKGRQDEKRGKIWTRIIREITVAARQGGPDIKDNPACAWPWTRPRPPTCRRTHQVQHRQGLGQPGRPVLRGNPLRGLWHRRCGHHPRHHDGQTASAPWPRCATPSASMAATWAPKARWPSSSSTAGSSCSRPERRKTR